MTDYLITFETAKLAKVKGFDVFTRKEYMHSEEWVVDWNSHPGEPGEFWKAPTQSLLQKWLREEHKLDVNVKRSDEVDRVYLYFVSVVDYRSEKYIETPIVHLWVSEEHNLNVGERYESYEQALEKGLQGALKLIE